MLVGFLPITGASGRGLEVFRLAVLLPLGQAVEEVDDAIQAARQLLQRSASVSPSSKKRRRYPRYYIPGVSTSPVVGLDASPAPVNNIRGVPVPVCGIASGGTFAAMGLIRQQAGDRVLTGCFMLTNSALT